MDAPAETPQPSTSFVPAADQASLPPSSPDNVGLSGVRLLLTSMGVFLGLVMVGGVVGLLVGRSSEDTSTGRAVASVAALQAVEAPVVGEPAEPNSTAQSSNSLEPFVYSDTPITEPEEEVVTEVLAAVEAEAPSPDLDTSDDTPPATSVEPVERNEVEFRELPKAVYDRFSLQSGDSFAINIAANDKIGGVLESVELTGLGELAPGFALDVDGTLSGQASVCGTWSAQYGLNSTNPAVGTSWIEITVVGCSDA